MSTNHLQDNMETPTPQLLVSASSSSSSSSSSPITILWATQTGRAKACARRTVRLLKSTIIRNDSNNHINNNNNTTNLHGLCAFDELDFLALGQSLVNHHNHHHHHHQTQQHQQQQQSSSSSSILILFVSTTGDAEQPASMQKTWSRLLSKSLTNTHFANVQFALFALGDRAYGPDAFCAAGRKLAARLVQLGAKPICRLGYGDDGSLNGGVFADLDVWLEKELFPVMRHIFDAKHDMMMTHAIQKGCATDDDLPYEVKVMQPKNGSTHGLCNGVREWQIMEYRKHYCDYFTHLHPATSYQYNDQMERMHAPIEHANNSPLLGRVTVNRRITSKDWMQDTRHIRIHVVESMRSDRSSMSSSSTLSSIAQVHALPYQAGDVASILPSNPPAMVERFLAVLPTPIRTMADAIIRIQHSPHRSRSTAVNHSWPEMCTLRGLLTHCADIQSLPEREDLFALSSYCNLDHPEGQEQRDKLIALSETTGAALYGDYIIREKRNWVDLFYDFDSIRWKRRNSDNNTEDSDDGTLLTISSLLALLPSISPRHFSIASSPSYIKHQSALSKLAVGFELELCVAVVEGTTPFGRPYAGCCSKYLASIVPDQNETANETDSLCLWIHPGSFSALPLTLATDERRADSATHRSFETPVLCIGAGTGIAPLRSLIFEREYQKLSAANMVGTLPPNEDDVTMGNLDNILIFGCRTQTDDYYYGDEWESLTNSKRLRLISAFSRGQTRKLYVQRALKEADGGELIATHILERHGAVYIAGGSKMARAVKDEIVAALGMRIDGGEKDAKRLLNKLKRTGLFSIEAWS